MMCLRFHFFFLFLIQSVENSLLRVKGVKGVGV